MPPRHCKSDLPFAACQHHASQTVQIFKTGWDAVTACTNRTSSGCLSALGLAAQTHSNSISTVSTDSAQTKMAEEVGPTTNAADQEKATHPETS